MYFRLNANVCCLCGTDTETVTGANVCCLCGTDTATGARPKLPNSNRRNYLADETNITDVARQPERSYNVDDDDDDDDVVIRQRQIGRRRRLVSSDDDADSENVPPTSQPSARRKSSVGKNVVSTALN